MSINPGLRITSIPRKLKQVAMIAACVVGTVPAMAQGNNQTDPANFLKLHQPIHRVEVYDGMPKTLACNPSTICLVKFECDEDIVSVGLSDAAYWEMLSPTKQDLIPRSYVGFKPRSNNWPANAIIFTNKRIYEFSLVIDDAERTSVLSFTYPDAEGDGAAADCTGTGTTADQ
ncbi:TrbG/VirB9 family P-type conjugative transfer protein [uncultured Ruegeria sp.]|uniref:TrbG/VirB9 family P-type conjugative transfer protein n=1 Tax=uncultured Ruegeria sp. TaxID=259304 RepID=UPI00260A3B28|nr:TrbG/VirB9 family P-type conjugative transfer protein [uncultured Ruegeria sp.]